MAHVQELTRPRSAVADDLPATPQYELDLWFRGEGDLSALRAAVRAYAISQDVADRADDILLVMHELVTNAIRHGGGQGRLRLLRRTAEPEESGTHRGLVRRPTGGDVVHHDGTRLGEHGEQGRATDGPAGDRAHERVGEARVAADPIICQVTDHGPGMTQGATRGTEPPGPNAAGGRGLLIVRRLSRLWVDSSPRGTTVTAALTP